MRCYDVRIGNAALRRPDTIASTGIPLSPSGVPLAAILPLSRRDRFPARVFLEHLRMDSPALGARVTWRQLVHYLNLAGFYAQRSARRGLSSRERGFSVRENLDGSILLGYASPPSDAAQCEREAMLQRYAAVLQKLRLEYEVADAVIVVRGWRGER